MKGILILAHGSRQKETEETLTRIVEMVQVETGLQHVTYAFLQFSNMNLEKGLLQLMEQGIDEIKVVPYFLFEGVHIKEDIPNEIQAFQQIHPGIRIDFGRTLGADSRLAAIVADRVRELL